MRRDPEEHRWRRQRSGATPVSYIHLDVYKRQQWSGSPAQKDALTRVDEISQAVQAALNNAAHIGSRNPELLGLLEEAHWRVLRAETSCNFFWGDAWVCLLYTSRCV